ncbi:hypothetical protein COV17_00355 [Candidatus Woesearchaeota archaeon CG10_big_fil_rev_8_21_14_0_10_36_11]|nr:MAG: hypothetical protein COV17_00355 [Candidatus Woesearchaeota archaeon CG10_big_fil_rev_8_21_14_0_10_36_11]
MTFCSITHFRIQTTTTFITLSNLNIYMKRSIIVLFTIILLSTLTLAQPELYNIKLLAVQEVGDHYEGSDADLYLELKEGTGRVFLDTFPVTKMDTQISTRFAKEIACKHFHLDCAQYDFIYTIKAKSNIIGGPSAGAAIAALTTIAVLDLDYNDDVTITGTINSGGIVGPVGGVKEKLEAASTAGLRKVLVAYGTSLSDNETNIIEYGKTNLSLDVQEVSELDEVVFYLTGINLNHKDVTIIENSEYTTIMKGLKNVLCSRIDSLEQELKDEDITLPENVLQDIQTRKERADNATEKNDLYSAASYCFGTNIELKKEYYTRKEITQGEMNMLFTVLEKKVNALETKINEEPIETITDLQTFMIVKERINDVREQIALFEERTGTESFEEMTYILAYAEERFFSALSWMQFFTMDGKEFMFDKENVKNSCIQKISEAEQRHQYIDLFISPALTLNIKEKIDMAYQAQNESKFALCLITASQAKADANAVLSSLGLQEDTILPFFESKQRAAERVISDNSAEGIFPILGYSYYQYAQSLQEQEPYTALLYMEYALEMGELSMYFPEKVSFLELTMLTIPQEWLFGGLGFVLGVLITTLIFIYKFERKTKHKK